MDIKEKIKVAKVQNRDEKINRVYNLKKELSVAYKDEETFWA